MPLDAIAALVTAVFELKAVQAVTRAINANLPKDGPLGTIRPNSAQLYARPRRYFSQTPGTRPLPRPVIAPTPKLAIARDHYDPRERDCPVTKKPVELWNLDGPTKSSKCGPMDPPWKHLPPVACCDNAIKVNLVRPKVDLITKGAMLDLFA